MVTSNQASTSVDAMLAQQAAWTIPPWPATMPETTARLIFARLYLEAMLTEVCERIAKCEGRGIGLWGQMMTLREQLEQGESDAAICIDMSHGYIVMKDGEKFMNLVSAMSANGGIVVKEATQSGLKTVVCDDIDQVLARAGRAAQPEN